MKSTKKEVGSSEKHPKFINEPTGMIVRSQCSKSNLSVSFSQSNNWMISETNEELLPEIVMTKNYHVVECFPYEITVNQNTNMRCHYDTFIVPLHESYYIKKIGNYTLNQFDYEKIDYPLTSVADEGFEIEKNNITGAWEVEHNKIKFDISQINQTHNDIRNLQSKNFDVDLSTVSDEKFSWKLSKWHLLLGCVALGLLIFFFKKISHRIT